MGRRQCIHSGMCWMKRIVKSMRGYLWRVREKSFCVCSCYTISSCLVLSSSLYLILTSLVDGYANPVNHHVKYEVYVQHYPQPLTPLQDLSDFLKSMVLDQRVRVLIHARISSIQHEVEELECGVYVPSFCDTRSKMMMGCGK